MPYDTQTQLQKMKINTLQKMYRKDKHNYGSLQVLTISKVFFFFFRINWIEVSGGVDCVGTDWLGSADSIDVVLLSGADSVGLVEFVLGWVTCNVKSN